MSIENREIVPIPGRVSVLENTQITKQNKAMVTEANAKLAKSLSTTSTLIKFTIFDLNTGKVKSKRFKESFVKSKTMKEKESEVN